MAIIEGFRVKNFGALKDVTLGKVWNTQKAKPLTPLTVVIGKNGAGKSTIFDAFGFIADCLKLGVEDACFARGRGGFEKIRSQEQTGPIKFELYYKEEAKALPITYELSINIDNSGKLYVEKERLRQRRKGQAKGRPFSFLILNEGKGIVWKGNAEGKQINEDKKTMDDLFASLKEAEQADESAETEFIELDDNRKLGIATLGSLKQHPRISAFRRFIEGWYLSYFDPNAARELPKAGPQRHLNVKGDNLGNVVQYMERDINKERFNRILQRISDKIPGIGEISTHKDDYSNNLYLLFKDKGFAVPFTHMQMSDGTLKVFAYLLLLEDPDPPPFICIEEPENGLYHKLLETLVFEFREHAERKNERSQIFVTTHQPYLVDALNPEEVWVMEKGDDGFSAIHRASDNQIVKNMVEEGQPLGSLWYSDYLDPR
ncbi:MAG: AAA family ATPase [Pedobacter sp.]